MIENKDFALLLARFLLAAMFIASASDKLRLDPVELKQIASLHLPAPALIERLIGVFEILCVAAIISGIYARLAAALLVFFVVFVSVFFVKFWVIEKGTEQHTMMRNTFFSNFAVVGGLIYIAIIGPGSLTLIDSISVSP